MKSMLYIVCVRTLRLSQHIASHSNGIYPVPCTYCSSLALVSKERPLSLKKASMPFDSVLQITL
jgi:hypothetical protein